MDLTCMLNYRRNENIESFSIKYQKLSKCFQLKKTIVILSGVLLITSCVSDKASETKTSGFELKGKLENPGGEQLYLEEMTAQGVHVTDTTTLDENGEFSFLNANPSLGFYRLRITDANFAMLILDSTQKVELTGNARDLGNTFRVKGSPESELFWTVNETSKKSFQKCDSILRAFEAYANLNKGDNAKLEQYNKEAELAYTTESKGLNNYLHDVINKNPASLVAIVALQQLTPEYSEDGNLSYFKLVDEALMKKYPGSAQVQAFHAGVESMLKTAVGALAPEISFPTPEGQALALSSLKGKYVIVDFWASWCKPCRAESPAMVKLYDKYHSKGLEIFSVSLDEKKESWMEAIKSDNLHWNHVSDLGGWQSAAAKSYGITSIPQTYLLDKEGKIIAKGLRSEGLAAKLETLIK